MRRDSPNFRDSCEWGHLLTAMWGQRRSLRTRTALNPHWNCTETALKQRFLKGFHKNSSLTGGIGLQLSSISLLMAFESFSFIFPFYGSRQWRHRAIRYAPPSSVYPSIHFPEIFPPSPPPKKCKIHQQQQNLIIIIINGNSNNGNGQEESKKCGSESICFVSNFGLVWIFEFDRHISWWKHLALEQHWNGTGTAREWMMGGGRWEEGGRGWVEYFPAVSLTILGRERDRGTHTQKKRNGSSRWNAICVHLTDGCHGYQLRGDGQRQRRFYPFLPVSTRFMPVRWWISRCFTWASLDCSSLTVWFS